MIFTILRNRRSMGRRQRGISLIELLIGIAIGLMVVAIAGSTLVVSRKVTGSVSDVSEIQQQGSYLLRVFGQQIRQASELRLVFYVDDYVATDDYNNPVGLIDEAKRFEPDVPGGLYGVKENVENEIILGFVNADDARPGSVEWQNAEKLWLGNCMGVPPREGPTFSHFFLSGTELKCKDGQGNHEQPVAGNVADFQTRYVVEDTDGQGKFKGLRYKKSTGMSNDDWRKVRSVEVCITLFGNEPVDIPEKAKYLDCTGQMVKYEKIVDASRRGRMHMTFRNVYQMRAKGLPSRYSS